MKTVLVTGAGRRLGAALARAFAEDRFRVILHAHSSFQEAKALSDKLNDQGCDTMAAACDFNVLPGVAQFFRQLIAKTGVPDVIVNNASSFEYDYPGSADEEVLGNSLSINVIAPVLIMDLAARSKNVDQNLSIFNILDQKVTNINPDYFSYTIGKAGLHAATKLWQATGRSDIRVFGIMPGLMFPSGGQTEEQFARDAIKNPLHRRVTTQDIYDSIQFFLSNGNIRGQNIAIDGGESLTNRSRDVAFE